MDNKMRIEGRELSVLVQRLAKQIEESQVGDQDYILVFGWPRGGVVVAGMLDGRRTADGREFLMVESILQADIVVDDVYDSGKTARDILKLMEESNHLLPMAFLVDKREELFQGRWIEFPWETRGEKDIEHHVTRILEYIGEDASRDGLLKTPYRVVKSWKEIYGGYTQNPAEILSTAFDNDGKYDEMVVLNDIAFHSMCEHHMLPFIGKCHIAYIPKADGKVVGISKLARLVECFAHRLQIQEKMTKDIAQALMDGLGIEDVAVVIEAQHLCMKMRGVKNTTSVMKTSSLNGEFRKPEVRAEFLSLVQ